MENSSHVLKTSTFRIYKFGNHYLNTGERKVFKNRKQLEIVVKAFDFLQLLVEKHGEILTKEEILENVWEDSFVEEGNLTVYISRIRKMLNASKSNPFIETVSGVGYRFVSKVEIIGEDEWKRLTSKIDHTINDNESNSPKTDSIAVLPLENENGDEDIDYLADGITESLINKLSYIPNLRVIARNTVFRYKNLNNIDFPKVGKELDVSNILTGRIRIIRDNIVIAVELINANDGSQIWGTQLNQPFEDIFKIQEEITKTISEKLKTRISKNFEILQSQTTTQNLESYRLYLKGKYFLNNRSLENLNNAMNCFQQSTLHDPTNLMAYIGTADCYTGLYIYEELSYQELRDQSLSLLAKVNEITNEPIAEFYKIKGFLKMFVEFNCQEAEKQFIISLSLNPNFIDVRFQYSKLLAYCGRIVDALNQTKELMKRDPISLATNKSISKIFYITEQFDNAIIKLQECLELKPLDFETLVLLGANLVEKHHFEKALNLFDKVLEIHFNMETLSMIGYTNARAGNVKEAKIILKQLEKHSTKTHIPSTHFAIIYSALGENDKVFEQLENAFEQKYSDLLALKVDPRYKPIRNDPRFNEMLLKIGLPID